MVGHHEELFGGEELSLAHPDPVVLELTRLQNQLKGLSSLTNSLSLTHTSTCMLVLPLVLHLMSNCLPPDSDCCSLILSEISTCICFSYFNVCFFFYAIMLESAYWIKSIHYALIEYNMKSQV